MKLKKFKVRLNQTFIKSCMAVVLLLLIRSSFSFAANSQEIIPVIHYLGVIPVQWDKDDTWSEMDSVKKNLTKDFYESVRSSQRFSTLNDDLVSSLWDTPAGRAELAKDYELQAFASLNVSSRGDMVVLTGRILSPKFQTYLQESEVVPRNWLVSCHTGINIVEFEWNGIWLAA